MIKLFKSDDNEITEIIGNMTGDRDLVLEISQDFVEKIFKTAIQKIESSGIIILSKKSMNNEAKINKKIFIKKCVKLMEVVGIKDFSMSDITNPKRKRLVIQLNGIIKFLKYIEFTKLENQIKETEDLLNKYQSEVSKIKTKKHVIEENIKSNQKQLNELKREVKEYEDKKTELRNSITSNPEKLNEELYLLKNKVEIGKLEVNEIEKELTITKGVNSSIIRNNKDIEELVKTLKDIKEQGLESTKVSELIQSETEEIEKCRRECNKIEMEMKRTERMIEREYINLNEITLKGEEDRKNRIIELGKAKEKCQALKIIADENNIKINKLNEGISILNKNLDDMNKKHHMEIESREKEYENVIKNIKIYHENLFSCLNKDKII